MYSSYYLLLFSFLPFWGRVDSLFQVSCSGYDSNRNRYSLPYFGGRERTLDRNKREESQRSVTYIYPVNRTRINCSGTIREVEFCYAISSIQDYGSNQVVFQLNLLSINGRDASVLSTATVSSVPNADKCTDSYCCDVMTLDSGITVGSSIGNLGIAISTPSSTNTVLQGFHSSLMDYSVMAYLQTVRPTGQFEIPESSKVQQGFRIVWFNIAPDQREQSSATRPIIPTSSTPAVSVPSISTTPDQHEQSSATRPIIPTSSTPAVSVLNISTIINAPDVNVNKNSIALTSSVNMITPSVDMITSSVDMITPSKLPKTTSSLTIVLSCSIVGGILVLIGCQCVVVIIIQLKRHSKVQVISRRMNTNNAPKNNEENYENADILTITKFNGSTILDIDKNEGYKVKGHNLDDIDMGSNVAYGTTSLQLSALTNVDVHAMDMSSDVSYGILKMSTEVDEDDYYYY